MEISEEKEFISERHPNKKRRGSRVAGQNYYETINFSKNIEFEELTILWIKSLIEKYGEEELQYKLMELRRNGCQSD